MNIKTIIFDLGGVCFTDSVQHFAMKMNDKYEILPQQVYNIFGGKLGTQYIKSQITLDEFWNNAKQELNINDSNESLTELWLSGMQPIKGTFDIIKELNANGYETLFLSDNVKEGIEYLQEKYNFTDYFDDGLYSHQMGLRKPSPLLYKCILKKTLNSPEECIYIDDKEKFLTPAQDLGMNTTHFVNPTSLREFLYFAGVNIKPSLNKKNIL